MCEGVIVGLKVQRRPSVSSELEEMPRIWNICQGKPQIANRGSRASLTESQKATGVRCPSPLAFTPCHHLPQVLDMELMNLMFTLLGFGIVSVLVFLPVSPFLPFGMRIFTCVYPTIVWWEYLT
jgi:hypothetical protein